MHRYYVVAIIVSFALLALTLEMVRRRALTERYSLLWLLTAFVLLTLSTSPWALNALAKSLGIFYPPSALLVVGMGFFLLILLHFSLVISKLTEQNKILAQESAILSFRVSDLEAAIVSERARLVIRQPEAS
jgi:hypothetical protein